MSKTEILKVMAAGVAMTIVLGPMLIPGALSRQGINHTQLLSGLVGSFVWIAVLVEVIPLV